MNFDGMPMFYILLYTYIHYILYILYIHYSIYILYVYIYMNCIYYIYTLSIYTIFSNIIFFYTSIVAICLNRWIDGKTLSQISACFSFLSATTQKKGDLC